ncbi:MAG: GGDEF domain-containing protein [gamma proteobacterium symbiont of Taylorina sp.]|nr:GGDEF domain-containing protein [gamma proteobacterium symbiont of Taylorina sp.]
MPTKYRIIYASFLIYSIFLVVSNYYVYQQQKESLYNTFLVSKQSEANILSQLAKESLISENYSLLEWFFMRWGKDRHSVISLDIKNSNGFILAQFQRQVLESINRVKVISNISLNNESYQITLVSDTNRINTILEKLLKQLILISSFFTLILALSVWYLFRQFAILPLQIEIQQRQKVEANLQLEHQLLKRANDKLQDLASHDPLTGLRNRLDMEKDIEKIIVQHNKHGSPFAVLMFDIDWFKEINDKYGHDVGDSVLIEVARLLKQNIRQGDKVYRAGGEEFVMVLNRISYDDTILRAEKIRTSMENNVLQVNNNEIIRTVSGGLYHSSLIKTEKVEIILKLVDNALYESKSNGRNQISNVHTVLH